MSWKGLLPLAVLGLALSGCVQRWEKPGGTADQFEALHTACLSRAYQRFPPRVHQIVITPASRTAVTETCLPRLDGRGQSCTRTGGIYSPPVYSTVDDNDGARDQSVRACLFENGWRPARN
jgi:hypothetical protein